MVGSRDPTSRNSVKLALFYHVWMVNHWREIVREQLRAAKVSDLLKCAPLHAGIIGSDTAVEDFYKVAVDEVSTVSYFGPDPTLFEFPTLELLREHARTHDGAVCYFHTKGVSSPDEHRLTNDTWRRVMNKGVLMNWRQCVDALENGHDVAGCRFDLGNERLPYFAGNFWWATCEYIRTLPPISTHTRYEAEVWLFKNNPRSFDIAVPHL